MSTQQHTDAMEALRIALGVPRSEDVQAMVDKAIAYMEMPRKVEYTVGADLPPITLDTPHKQLDALLSVLLTKEYVWLAGSAGAGKTTACAQCADLLSLPFYAISVNQGTMVHNIMGYIDAGGNYQSTPARHAWEFGGVLLLDEIDRGSAEANLCLNMVAETSTVKIAFPDSVQGIERHKDFYLVASANTIGNGADSLYVGANQQDAALKNRFFVMEWEIDPALESALAQGHLDVYAYVLAARKAIKELGINAIVSPRQTKQAAKFKSAGLNNTLIKQAILGGLDQDTRESVENHSVMNAVKGLLNG